MDKLFERLIENKLTTDDLRRLRMHFETASDEELLELFGDGDNMNIDAAKMVTDTMLSRVKTRIDNRIEQSGRTTVTPGGVIRRRFIWIAAAIIPVCLAFMLWIFSDRYGNAEKEPSMCCVETGNGESSTVSLCDGTEVMLYGGSRLTFQPAVKEWERSVDFSGEGYFDVARNTDLPFRIHTPAMSVTVYGTKFNLLSYKSGRFSELSLDSGIVSLNIAGRQDSIMLSGRQSFLLDTATGEFEIRSLPDRESSRRDVSELIFVSASPEYVVDRLQRNYDTLIPQSIVNAINDDFSGTLPADNMDSALGILGKIYGFTP